VAGTGTFHLLVLFASELLDHTLVLVAVWLLLLPLRGAVSSTRQLVNTSIDHDACAFFCESRASLHIAGE